MVTGTALPNIFMRLGLDSCYLIHLGIHDLNLNVLEKRLRHYFQDELSRSFYSLESYSLHPIHTIFRTTLQAFLFDLHYFFKNVEAF